MSDLIKRAQNAKTLVSDVSLPKWQRLLQAFQAFSGLELTGILDEVRQPFEAALIRVQRIVGQYPVGKEEDYQLIGDDDLRRMLEIIDVAASCAIAAELDRIVAGLDAGIEKLPVEAIREAREHRDLMVPKLIEVLRDATSRALMGDIPEGNGHFFAIFLLTEFKAEEAFPAIVEAFFLPDELPFDMFGDAVTIIFARILAQFAGDRPEVMDTLIGNQGLDESVRWEAAQSYVYLVRDGRIQRDEAVHRLHQHLREALGRNDAAITGSLICVLMSFAPEEAIEDIKAAFQSDLVDPFLVGLDEVEQAIAEGEAWTRQELERCPATGIEDTIKVLENWSSFWEEPAPLHVPQPLPSPPSSHFADIREPAEFAPTPVLSRGSHVGRNEPCPCGSGRKFKKCCGSRK